MAERGAGFQGRRAKGEVVRGWRLRVRVVVVMLAEEGERVFGGHCCGLDGVVWWLEE